MVGDLRAGMICHVGILAICLMKATGCGPAGPDVQMIKGVITLDGKPVTAATVVFVPEGVGLMAAGKTDEAGAFVLNASDGKKFGRGTTEGDYIVTLSKLTSFKLDPATGDPTDIPLANPKQLMPRVYTTATESPLRATVVKGVNEFEFDLKKKQ